MRKDKKIWIKQEKRLVKLLYKKGFLTDFKLSDFYWAEFHNSGKKYSSGKYRFSEYYPEIHYSTTDYWGEGDEHSIVDTIKEALYWEGVDGNNLNADGEYPKSSFKYYHRRRLIKYLNSLPTVISDNKINEIVNIRKKDY
jgi:hypothetical protein